MRKILWWIFIAAMLSVFCYSGWNLYSYWKEENTAGQTFDSITEIYQKAEGQTIPDVHPESPDASPEETVEEEAQADESISEGVLALHGENPDCVGWVQIEGTNVNYPVMYHPETKDYYLHRDFNGEYSKSGTPYIAEKCDLQTSDNITIYGHHMNSGSMFADLDKYKSRDYYLEHPVIQFDTIYGKGVYQIIAVFVTSVYESDIFAYYAFVEAENEGEYMDYVNTCKDLALYETGNSAEYGDKLITLSTCEYTLTNGRVVVVAKKMKG